MGTNPQQSLRPALADDETKPERGWTREGRRNGDGDVGPENGDPRTGTHDTSPFCVPAEGKKPVKKSTPREDVIYESTAP
jgi:hypothetical protein